MKIKVTYSTKALFLFFSWLFLFKTNAITSTDDSNIFLTSIMIYSGAIIFDLIFFAIESEPRVSDRLKGAYYGSIILIIINVLITFVAFLGANGLVTIIQEDTYQIEIKSGFLTDVYSGLLSVKLKLGVYLFLVLSFGLLEIIPGLLIAKEDSQKQVDSSD